MIPAAVPASKSAVRDYLRSHGQEAEWTALQGIVYGPRLEDAEPFAGVLDFLRHCHGSGIACRIISHKTEYPALGERYDLHAAALNWLSAKGFLNSATGLNLEAVFLETSRLAKLQRIASENCVLFIDDLPECLTDAAFPAGVERVLFDPQASMPLGPYQRCGSWDEIARFVLGARERQSP
ncbi:MAG TPA: hypothetical protein VE988_18565 [Gemmataceae bacterium]|nr:hypothetical protein [Gemmataceae bacterium]